MNRKKNRKLYLFILIYIWSFIWVVTDAAHAQDIKQTLGSLKEFMVSEDYGTIRDSYFAGNNHGIIIHIQDLHCNYDAQMSIYHILDELIDKYGLNLVTIEGVEGELDTAPFSDYPDEEIKERVSKHFIKTGELNGAALAHIMRKSGFIFWGADDRDMHLDNVEAYKVSIKEKATNVRYYNNMKSILDEFKSKVYSKELKELDDKIEGYKKEELTFSEYVAYLNDSIKRLPSPHRGEGQGEGEEYPNFTKLTEVLRKEAEINFVEVDTERAEYMDMLSKELDKESLSELLDKSLYFKMGKIGAVGFYTYLEELSSRKDVTPIADYPQLAAYIVYIKLYSDIENIKLFKEIEAVETALKEKLFTDDIQRKVDRLSHNLEILNDLFNLKLTKETLQYYRDNRKEFMTSNYITFISENAPGYGIRYRLEPSFRKVDAELPNLERFYQLAEERDIIMVKNTIDKMRQDNAKLAALVSGGFHTDGITKFLKEKDLSYVVITPKVNNLQEDSNPYKSVLLGEKNEYDELYDMVLKTIKYVDIIEGKKVEGRR